MKSEMVSISSKIRSVSATSSSGGSVVLHTPVDEPDVYRSAHDDDPARPMSEYGHPKKDYPDYQSGAPLLDHSSCLRGPDLGEVGYNLEHLATSHVTPASNCREFSRHFITGSDFVGQKSGYVIRFKRAT